MQINQIEMEDPNVAIPSPLNATTYSIKRTVNGTAIPQQFSGSKSFIIKMTWTHAKDETIERLLELVHTDGEPHLVEINIKGKEYSGKFYLESGDLKPGRTLTTSITVNCEPEK